MTFAIFHDFPGLENGLSKFHDQGAPCSMPFSEVYILLSDFKFIVTLTLYKNSNDGMKMCVKNYHTGPLGCISLKCTGQLPVNSIQFHIQQQVQ